MSSINKSDKRLPRKGQKVTTNNVASTSQDAALLFVGKEYFKSRKNSSGKFLCFAIFELDSDKQEIWFIQHEDDTIAAYYPYEVTIYGE